MPRDEDRAGMRVVRCVLGGYTTIFTGACIARLLDIYIYNIQSILQTYCSVLF